MSGSPIAKPATTPSATSPPARWPDSARDEVFDVRPYAQRIAYAFLRKDLTSDLPRKFKIAFDGCGDRDCIAGAINDIGLRAVIRDGRRGFRVVIGGGLGPLPTEAQLLDEFLPEERLMNRCEAVVRVFNKYGNRQNRNKARHEIHLARARHRLAARADRKANTPISWPMAASPGPKSVPEGFGGYQSHPQPLGQGALLPVVHTNGSGDPAIRRLARDQRHRAEAGRLRHCGRSRRPGQPHRPRRCAAWPASPPDAGDGLLRIGIDQNILLGFIPLGKLRGLHAALRDLGLGDAGAREIGDVTTCPGAYSCNLALTKSMNLGAALQDVVRRYDDPLARRLSIKVSGCPNSCGQHWIADFGFYGNARKIDGREVPYYQMLLGGGFDEEGIMRFGLAVQSVPARLAPEAVSRVLDHYLAQRAPQAKPSGNT